MTVRKVDLERIDSKDVAESVRLIGDFFIGLLSRLSSTVYDPAPDLSKYEAKLVWATRASTVLRTVERHEHVIGVTLSLTSIILEHCVSSTASTVTEAGAIVVLEMSDRATPVENRRAELELKVRSLQTRQLAYETGRVLSWLFFRKSVFDSSELDDDFVKPGAGEDFFFP